MKKVLYWIMILAVIGGIGKSCESCSSDDNKEATTKQAHMNNSDGYYDGQYSFRRGLEHGDLEIRGDGWAVTYVDNDPITGSYSPHSFNGRIKGSNLVIGNVQYSYDYSYVGEIFAEFDGKNISSGGWTYTR